MSVYAKVVGDQIKAICDICGATTTVPNKGLGRATLATWKTRHQHSEGES